MPRYSYRRGRYLTRAPGYRTNAFKRRRYGSYQGRYYSGRVPLATRGFKGYLGRRAQVEKNFVDVQISVTPTNGTSSASLLNGMVPGTGVSARVGRRVCLKSVQIRGVMSARLYSGDITNLPSLDGISWRMVLAWDTQPNATPITVNTILVSDSIQSLTNLNNRERFKILMDKVGTFSFTGAVPSTSGDTDGNAISVAQHTFKKYIKLNHVTTFNAGTTGDVTDIVTGALWLLMMTTASSVAGETSNYILSTRVRYTDA